MSKRKRSIYQQITIEEAKARLRSEWHPVWSDLDAYIMPIVKVLYLEGIETYQSCQGGPGHSFLEPTVQFYGQISEGFRALNIAHQYDLKPIELRRVWSIQDKEPVGPNWEMTFSVPGCPTWSGG